MEWYGSFQGCCGLSEDLLTLQPVCSGNDRDIKKYYKLIEFGVLLFYVTWVIAGCWRRDRVVLRWTAFFCIVPYDLALSRGTLWFIRYSATMLL